MKLRPFELALIVIFGILMVLSLILLKLYKPAVDSKVVTFGGPVTIWGTVPEDAFYNLIQDLISVNENFQSVSYYYVPERDFSAKFVSALADGAGPDLLFLNQESLVQHRGRLEVIPYASFPVRDFKTAYVEGAEIFALTDGIYGFPVAVDPLMLYWNRDLFSGVNRLAPPATWEEVVGEVVPALTARDFNRNISQSAVAMGEYENIRNAFPIISMLLLQGGSSLVSESNNKYRVALDERMGSIEAKPFSDALAFYVNFNNVSNTLYSWNKALANDRELFLSEKLALYFGFGSEAALLETKNPNLNFDIAPVPQGATVSASAKRNYGLFYAFMIPKGAVNKAGAYAVMQELGSVTNAKKIADAYNMAPVHRSSLMAGSNDVYGREIYAAVAQSRGWLNPSRAKSDEILGLLLDDIAANRSNLFIATNDTLLRLQKAY